ncbi:hypothetical protein [Roseateles sp. P5_E7]
MSFHLGRVMAACLLAACVQVAAAADLPRKQFELRVEETGTRFGRAAMTSQGLPLNRRYAELDAKEKALVRANYEGMPEADEPPFPADGLLPVMTTLHIGAERGFPLGKLAVVVDVDSSGKVQHAQTFGKVDADFARFAASVLARTPFKPAVCAGNPCAMQYVFRIEFGGV